VRTLVLRHCTTVYVSIHTVSACLGLACLDLFQLISSHKILFILPALYYSCSQPNRAHLLSEPRALRRAELVAGCALQQPPEAGAHRHWWQIGRSLPSAGERQKRARKRSTNPTHTSYSILGPAPAASSRAQRTARFLPCQGMEGAHAGARSIEPSPIYEREVKCPASYLGVFMDAPSSFNPFWCAEKYSCAYAEHLSPCS